MYVWSILDKNNRQELLQLSSIHKIYRKRGLKLITICVDGNKFFDVAFKLLSETQSSGTNYISSGTDISPLVDLRAIKGIKTTSFLGLLTPQAKIFYRSTEGLDSLEIK